MKTISAATVGEKKKEEEKKNPEPTREQIKIYYCLGF